MRHYAGDQGCAGAAEVTPEVLEAGWRKAIGGVIYRGLINFLFLVAAFDAFPEHRWLFGLGILVFNQGIGATVLGISLTAAAQNYLDDSAERKTRHAILLAHTEFLGRYDFWSEVDRRVAEERGPEPEPPNGWSKFGSIIWSFAASLIADLATIFLALIFAS